MAVKDPLATGGDPVLKSVLHVSGGELCMILVHPALMSRLWRKKPTKGDCGGSKSLNQVKLADELCGIPGFWA